MLPPTRPPLLHSSTMPATSQAYLQPVGVMQPASLVMGHGNGNASSPNLRRGSFTSQPQRANPHPHGEQHRTLLMPWSDDQSASAHGHAAFDNSFLHRDLSFARPRVTSVETRDPRVSAAALAREVVAQGGEEADADVLDATVLRKPLRGDDAKSDSGAGCKLGWLHDPLDPRGSFMRRWCVQCETYRGTYRGTY